MGAVPPATSSLCVPRLHGEHKAADLIHKDEACLRPTLSGNQRFCHNSGLTGYFSRPKYMIDPCI